MTIELPEHLRTGPLAEAAAKALQDAASMAQSSNSVPRISLRGREFRCIESGEELVRFRDSMKVIMIGVEPEAGRMIKTFYSKGYVSGAKEPPSCSSDDGITPAPWVSERQASHCAQCPKNTFGSATSPNGKPTKACRDSKRVWLKLAEGNIPVGATAPYEVPAFADRTLYGLNVTVASLKSFSDHGRALHALGQGPAVCITKLVMLDKEYPELTFEIAGWLSADDAPQSLKIATDRPWRVQYANAGLALSHEVGTSGGGVPTSLPGHTVAVPDHLKPQKDNSAAEDAVPAKKPSDFDDAIKNF